MGKSTETFSKKEREKKKLKKQRDKKDKSDDRKSAAVKGQGLNEMMAYVDQDGNLTNVPQELGVRRKVASEDIQIGTPKQEAVEEEAIRNGIITHFNEAKGYGFIRDLKTQESIFFHIHAITEQVNESDKVTFEVELGQKGLNAIKVKKRTI
jgi:cold shock CspA family protein